MAIYPTLNQKKLLPNFTHKLFSITANRLRTLIKFSLFLECILFFLNIFYSFYTLIHYLCSQIKTRSRLREQ